MTALATNADRAAEAIQSLRNDWLIAQQSPILRRLAADFDHLFSPPLRQPSSAASRDALADGVFSSNTAGVAGKDY